MYIPCNLITCTDRAAIYVHPRGADGKCREHDRIMVCGKHAQKLVARKMATYSHTGEDD
jgi:hypothetical protein